MRLGYRLCLCGLLAGSAVLAQDIDYGAAAESISAVLADPTFVPYAKPTQKVSEWIAVGDSYTAGTGCNMAQDAANWGFVNNDDTLPRFSFHAYTGDKVQDLVAHQLKQGDYREGDDLPRNQPFGKPQLAVVTIGGNDAMLSTILNDCVYRVALPGDCQETLNNLQRELDSGSFQDKVNYGLFQVAHAGREAGGASPRESFQVFVLEYVTFFGTGAECNDYSWSYFGWSTPKLSLALRQQLNDMVLKVNAAIKAAAEDLRRMGVIYVEGIQDAYNGHRYCEPGASHDMTEYNVWFWTVSVTVAASDYSSVTLNWSSVANALGYAVYMNGNQVLELPPSLTRATIGMLDPGTSGITFEVSTVLSSGSGGTSRTISTSTKSLPEDGTIANVGFTESGDTVTYTADVLVPYAFVRLFVGKDQPDPGIGSGWPIQSPELTDQGVAEYQIVNYMVEGNDFYSGLYEYTGAWYETTTANADWTWATIAEAKQTQDGYTYTWSVPLGSTEAVAKEYVIQGQGYARSTMSSRGLCVTTGRFEEGGKARCVHGGKTY
ncbi:SGNH hydrolase-type esterase domain-containing protein [Aspergillus fruticulosus]